MVSPPPLGPPGLPGPVPYGGRPAPSYPNHPAVGASPPYGWAEPRERPPARPGVVGVAATLAVTASLLWICGLTLAWLAAAQAQAGLNTTGPEGGLFHLLNRFTNRMLDGLAWPLYLFPAAGLTTGFLLLTRRPWARIAYTVTGLAALSWAAWWLQPDLLWWLPVAAYILVAFLIVWTPSASRWYHWRPPETSPETLA